MNVRVSTLGAAELSDAVPGAFPRGWFAKSRRDGCYLL